MVTLIEGLDNKWIIPKSVYKLICPCVCCAIARDPEPHGLETFDLLTFSKIAKVRKSFYQSFGETKIGKKKKIVWAGY